MTGWISIALAVAVGCGGSESALSPEDNAPGDGGPVVEDVGDAAAPITSFAGTLTGTVTANGAPLVGAEVRFGGRHETAITAIDGTFALVVLDPPVELDRIGLAASKPGYYNGGRHVFDPLVPQPLELVEITQADDPSYAFKSADDGEATPHCKHCHDEQVSDWQGSAHARAAKDPQLHDLYNGTASGITDETTCVSRGGTWRSGKAYGAPGSALKCYVGAGVLPDLNVGRCGGDLSTCDDPDALPQDLAVSVCADCHAPASVGHTPGATNLNTVDGIAFDEGVTCDFCHKIEAVTVNQQPGLAGAITLRRPAPPPPDQVGGFSDPEVMFGPYGDTIAFFMGGSQQPQFRRSELCSACHQWSASGFRVEDAALIDPVKWPQGLPLQDTYDEWAASSWAAAGVECQHCHMPASQAPNVANDKHNLPTSPAGNLGWDRPFGDIRRHLFRSRVEPLPGWSPPDGEPGMDVLRNPLDLGVQAIQIGGQLTVSVSIANTGAGHAIPSGTPSRALFLLVRAEADGARLPAIAGQTVPAWTGSLLTGDAHVVGTTLVLDPDVAIPADLGVGSIVRFVQPTGALANDPGVGWFGRPERRAEDKQLPVWAPVGEATVIGVQPSGLTLDRAVVVPAGTTFLVGGVPTLEGVGVDDTLPEVALAGAPGWVFGKVMQDRGGSLGTPFWRAIDIAADNRIPPGQAATTAHVFDAGAATGSIKITATLLYRRHAFSQVRLRGWQAVDEVRAVSTIVVP